MDIGMTSATIGDGVTSIGKLTFNCETEGVVYVSDIKNKDIGERYAGEINLTPTYTTTVYATKTGYDNSDVATATITWRNGSPKMEGFSTINMALDEGSGDVNGDNAVDVADIGTIIDIMAAKAGLQQMTVAEE